jgi:hypothetical protein
LEQNLPCSRSHTKRNKMNDREAFEERAAILQYDAGMSKAEAEKKAKALIEKREMLDKIEKMRENKH